MFKRSTEIGEPALDVAPVEAAVPANSDRWQRLVETSRIFVDARSWDREKFGNLLGGQKGLVQGNGSGLKGLGIKIGVHASTGANRTRLRLPDLSTTS